MCQRLGKKGLRQRCRKNFELSLRTASCKVCPFPRRTPSSLTIASVGVLFLSKEIEASSNLLARTGTRGPWESRTILACACAGPYFTIGNYGGEKTSCTSLMMICSRQQVVARADRRRLFSCCGLQITHPAHGLFVIDRRHDKLHSCRCRCALP